MKKLLLILVLVFTMLLGSCSAQNKDTYDVTFQNRTFTVNTINKTITYEGQAYRYEVNGSTVTITYPDNSEYWWTQQKNGGHGGWSDNYDENEYIPGPDLIAVLTSETPSNKSQKNYFLIVLFIALGLWNVVSPYTSWYLSHGWKYKNAEPSEAVLIVSRIAGGILVLAGVILIFI